MANEASAVLWTTRSRRRSVSAWRAAHYSRRVIDQYYPRAHRHLLSAQGAKSAVASLWADLLEDDLVQQYVYTAADGSGSVSALAAWPPGVQGELTERFRTCVRELWACLDELVIETVESFSVHKRVRAPESSRFFPLADSQEGFQALLAESCMDGVLRSHMAMVRDCQPFQGNGDDEMVNRLRYGLRLLLEWDKALEAGAQVAAWAAPENPQVYAQAPAVVERVEAGAAGVLDDDERVLARFQLGSYIDGCSVSALADTRIDLCFPHSFVPADAHDTLGSRLSLVIEVVTRFAVSFAWLSEQVPGSRRVLGTGVESADEGLWIRAASSPQPWSDQDLAQLAASDTGVGIVQGTATLTLIVNTAEGAFERVIPHATPLRSHDQRGAAAETAVRDAAATWGLPDFVVTPSVERKGRGVREISDGLLVVGNRGVVVQVKARDSDPTRPKREEAWILKQISAAARQIDGTVRRLSAERTQMTNGRGRRIHIDGPAIAWVGVVIIEHPAPPHDLAIPEHQDRTPTIVLLRRDWEFLFNQLRSTHAVVQYLHRVGTSAPGLGAEPERYYELAAADEAAPTRPLSPSSIRPGAVTQSMPLLPAAPAGSDDNTAHAMVRIILEDIATSPIGPDDLEYRQRVLAYLDGLQVGYRTELGRFLLDNLSVVSQADPDTIEWRMRTFIGGLDEDHFGFVVANTSTELTRNAFRSWLHLRHHERGESGDLETMVTVGVMLTPRADGPREWDTAAVLISGNPELTDEELQTYRRLWNQAGDLDEPDSGSE